jgi:hypothetical protein
MILRFRINMDDYPEVQRVIEIKDDQTFEELHNAILKSVDFDDSQMASFYLCDDNWNEKLEITLIDLTDEEEEIFTPTMSKIKLSEYMQHPGAKLEYVYDFVLMWKFRIELDAIEEMPEGKKKYPVVIDSIGEAPPQFAQDKFPEPISEEEEAVFVKGLLMKNHEKFNPENDLLDDDDELEEEDPWDAGFSELEGGHEDY